MLDEKRGMEGLETIIATQLASPHVLLSKAIVHCASFRAPFFPSRVSQPSRLAPLLAASYLPLTLYSQLRTRRSLFASTDARSCCVSWPTSRRIFLSPLLHLGRNL